MPRNELELQEWYDEMREDAIREQYEERNLHEDEDYFISKFVDNDLAVALNNLRKACKEYGYDYIDIIKDI